MRQSNDVSTLARTYSAYSGVDIKLVFDNIVVAEASTLTFAITRDKAPIYTMGHADPRTFVRGKRAIAGTAVFAQFDRKPLAGVIPTAKYFAKKDDLKIKAPHEYGGPVSEDNIGADWSYAYYLDQMLPVDVTLVAVNEYGQKGTMVVNAIEFLYEGSVVSIDDLGSEVQTTWVARGVTPWLPAAVPDETDSQTQDYLDWARRATEQAYED